MTQEMVTDLVAAAVITVLKVSAPPLLMGLAVGILVSIFQAVTSIQEQTLAYVPKIAAVFLSLVIWGQWMVTQLTDFMQTEIFATFQEFIK